MAKEICEECGGKGYIPNPDMDFYDPESVDTIDCPPCNGEGWIETEGDDEEGDD